MGRAVCQASQSMAARLLRAVVVLTLGAGIAPVLAQGLPRELPGSVQPGRDRPLPVPVSPESDFDFTIQAPRRTPVPSAADELTFTLRDIKVSSSAALGT